MHRSIVAASVVIVAISAVGCKAKPQFLPTVVTEKINVKVTCDASSFTARIDPYSIELRNSQAQTRDAEWVLDNSSSVDSISINEKRQNHWPFGGNLPIKAKKNSPGKGNGVLSQPPGKYKYEYTVTAFCTFNNEPKQIVIDPDMIIIWN